MTAVPVGVSPEWLQLREEADAAARSRALVHRLVEHLPEGTAYIHDLGCGTGAMARWLAPLLPRPQHWVMHDHDPALLAQAARTVPTAAGGAPVTVEVREGDLTHLSRGELAGASLVTASALLDLLTATELDRLVTACGEAGCPVLFTLSVVGQVRLSPRDPLDPLVAAAFDHHQRRTVDGRTLLGPDALARAAEAFARTGAEVLVRPSPWRLDAHQSSLAAQWFTGWLDAACEDSPDLAARAERYGRRRLAAAYAGRLRVSVGHADLLVVPR
ncbi:class I SAM-dependent methyltransferase [Nostocoides sp. HKS02]|uniref:methyltransferase domain-containing protein n=1 Tax=Nostocoides sp. HKS02 TaxID=1813880 RepID=UPI0012B4B08F|nr:class I SAM-dependent methyltransferase [Tetrasphaera sp. HKS02]QGN57242.1 methyltransferase domain-containing protein [Tetrasphaera sp. HKS02]